LRIVRASVFPFRGGERGVGLLALVRRCREDKAALPRPREKNKHITPLSPPPHPQKTIAKKAGPDVKTLAVGDRVVACFDICGCGARCFWCQRGLFSSCAARCVVVCAFDARFVCFCMTVSAAPVLRNT
jgi:hypothetical protein